MQNKLHILAHFWPSLDIETNCLFPCLQQNLYGKLHNIPCPAPPPKVDPQFPIPVRRERRERKRGKTLEKAFKRPETEGEEEDGFTGRRQRRLEVSLPLSFPFSFSSTRSSAASIPLMRARSLFSDAGKGFTKKGKAWL